ncbi:uncharacterized protein LOC116004019 [Ipomoea triloba]|uniref:uncharacterized protein LOC116004019 n=1 Tax=Ipomoea triloba TaxID=35885 RepID=UPI00125CD617|nr:uncharacterized protein LOC116004019 [Ipomoea triloba]
MGVLHKLNDALWAFRTIYKAPTDTTPYQLVYGKAYRLPVEVEHRAYWAIKKLNEDLSIAGRERTLQLNELEEWCLLAYETLKAYKERSKLYHDMHIKINKEFVVGES